MASVQQIKILKVDSGISEEPDLLAVEEPLEMRLGYGPAGRREQSTISVTMRTPGNDFELVLGFLLTEGIIHNFEEVASIRYCQSQQQNEGNVVRVELLPDVQVDMKRLQRNFYTTSSCGVCGKTSIESVETLCPVPDRKQVTIEEDIIHNAPAVLRQAQLVFKHTGGLHAAGLFDREGRLLIWREDVGRHNALDKLIGACLTQGKLPLKDNFIMLSGRVSFELVQKALMAGTAMVAAVGAPSSLAVKLARQYNLALLGFVRDQRFNIYSGSHCIIFNENLQQNAG